jgi:hypothetical protein
MRGERGREEFRTAEKPFINKLAPKQSVAITGFFMNKSIYVRRGTEQFGPYDSETLLGLINQGQLSPQDLAWHDTLGDEWKPLAQVLNLKAGEVTTSGPGVSAPHAAATGQVGASLQQVEVVITGVKIGFMDLVTIILKVWMASIPAMIILWIIMAIIAGLFSALFGSLFFFHSATDSH